MDDSGLPLYYNSLAEDQKQRIDNYQLLVYECVGTETEIKEWFKTINIAGVPLNEQELLNAVYSGPFVTLAKEEFSNSRNANVQKWSAYVKGSVNRQDFLHTALEWVSRGQVGDYMSRHRNDGNINELKTYFTTVIDWVSTVFVDVMSEMRGLEWGRLYETYHKNAYDHNQVHERLMQLYADDYINGHSGLFEYILGGETDKRLLNLRLFDKATISKAYTRQTVEAQEKGVSNCPYCAMSDTSNRTRIWKLGEMDADHVTAWSKGGATDLANCQMLCKTHNRAKGNK